jgi:anti-sigma-K factor RskA
MKSFKRIAIVFAAVVALGALGTAAHAQDVNTAAPIVVKQKPTKAIWMKATVIHADAASLIVRERDNQMAIHTFNYSDEAKAKMQGIIDAGGYQNGDNIRVLYMPGTETAIKFKGRPSKSS